MSSGNMSDSSSGDDVPLAAMMNKQRKQRHQKDLTGAKDTPSLFPKLSTDSLALIFQCIEAVEASALSTTCSWMNDGIKRSLNLPRAVTCRVSQVAELVKRCRKLEKIDETMTATIASYRGPSRGEPYANLARQWEKGSIDYALPDIFDSNILEDDAFKKAQLSRETCSIRFLAISFSGLGALEGITTRFQSDLVRFPDTEFLHIGLWEALPVVPNFREYFPRVKRVSILDGETIGNFASIIAFLEVLPDTVEDFRCTLVRTWNDFEYMSSDSEEHVALREALKKLNLKHCEILMGEGGGLEISEEFELSLLHSLPSLTSWSLRLGRRRYPGSPVSIAKDWLPRDQSDDSYPNLRDIVITYDDHQDEDSLQQDLMSIFSGTPNLTHLNVNAVDFKMHAFDTRVHFGAGSLQSLTLQHVFFDENAVKNFSTSFPKLTRISLINVCFEVKNGAEEESNDTESCGENERRKCIERLAAILARSLAEMPLTQIDIKVLYMRWRQDFRERTTRGTASLIRLSGEYLLQQILKHDTLCRKVLLDVSLRISSKWKVNKGKIVEDPVYKRFMASQSDADDDGYNPCLADLACLERLTNDRLVFENVYEDIPAACRLRTVRSHIIKIEEAMMPEVDNQPDASNASASGVAAPSFAAPVWSFGGTIATSVSEMSGNAKPNGDPVWFGVINTHIVNGRVFREQVCPLKKRIGHDYRRCWYFDNYVADELPLEEM